MTVIDAGAFRAEGRTTCLIAHRATPSIASVNRRCASSKKNTSFGLSRIADLRKLLEDSLGRVATAVSIEAAEFIHPCCHRRKGILMTPRPSRWSSSSESSIDEGAISPEELLRRHGFFQDRQLALHRADRWRRHCRRIWCRYPLAFLKWNG